MKKKIVSSLVAVILVATMIGCTRDAEHVDKQPMGTEVVTDVFADSEEIQNETETITEFSTESVKETEEVAILKPLVDGKILVTKATEYDVDGNFRIEEIFEYDTAGRMTHYTNTMAGGYVLEEEHREYDNKGNLTLIKNKKYENYSTHYTEYEYDSNNYMVEESIYWKAEGEVPNPTRYCYKYDSKGNMIECTQIEGEWTDTYIYEYNSNNQLVKEYPSKWPDDATIYEYDANGNLLKKAVGSTVETYEYDANNNCVLYTLYWGDEKKQTIEYEFDSRQNKIKETCYVSGTLNYQFVWEYDAYGAITRGIDEEMYNQEYFCEYEYDSNGVAIKKNNFRNQEKELSGWVIYEYIVIPEN